MGQGNQRKQRIAGLSNVAAGPGHFPELGQSLLLLARTDSDNRIRLASAVRDLVNKPALDAMITNQEVSSLDAASWIAITFVPEGPISFKLLSKVDDALSFAIDLYGEGFTARGHRWTTLVFASPSEVADVRGLVSRFIDDLPQERRPLSQGKISVSQETTPKVRIEISRAEVEAMDLVDVLMALDIYASSREMLERLGANFIIEFSGYDDDPRFLGEIPNVASYIRQINLFAPWAPLVSHPDSYLLWLQCLSDQCIVHTDGAGLTLFHWPPGEGERVIDKLFWKAADLAGERLLIQNNMPSCLASSVQSWVDFLAADGAHFANSESEALVKAQTHIYPEPEPSELNTARNEKEFWESVVETSSPGWTAHYDPSQVNETPVLAGRDVVVYAIDTRTGWIYAAGFPLSQAEHILRMGKTPKFAEGVPSLAIATIRDNASKGSNVDNSQSRLAVVASLAALGLTKLVNAVLEQTGSINGHYLYMIYSKRDGSVMARPSYALWDSPGIMPMENLYAVAAETIRSDLATPNGFVGSDIVKGGGLILCQHLQDLLG